MMKRLLIVNVRGKGSTWGLRLYADHAFLAEWRADGLDIIEVSNTIPAWIVMLGLGCHWCFLQDAFNFKNPRSP